jgi:hypothetical protein
MTTKGDGMLAQDEAQQQRVLAMIEAALRSGRTEREIIGIVDEYFGAGAACDRRNATERRFVRRLLARTR